MWDKFATGGIGDIYFAGDLDNSNRRVAIKVPESSSVSNPNALKLFILEAKMLELARSPAVVSLLEVGLHGDTPFLAMEFIPGRTLQSRYLTSIRNALEVMLRVCDSVIEVHKKGVVHRDLKPGNMFLVGNRVKLIDFQYAKPLNGTDETRYAVGSPEYISPEQTVYSPSRETNFTSDVYSLGVLAYMFAVRGFSKSSKDVFPIDLRRDLSTQKYIQDCLQRHREQKPIPLLDRIDSAPRELSMLLDKAVSKKPEDRQHTVEEFKGDIMEVLHRM